MNATPILLEHPLRRAIRVQILARLSCSAAWDDVRYISQIGKLPYPTEEEYEKRYLHKFVELWERKLPMDKQDVIEIAAKTAHEVNRAYCVGLGDYSLAAWEEAPEWQRTSVRNGVSGVLAGNSPEQSHESWLNEKVSTGWTYGPVKDPEKKEHPCMVPYDQLPPAQRFKDTLYVTAVRGVLMQYGLLS